MTNRRARRVLNYSRSLLGCLSGAFWRPLGASGGHLGGHRAVFERLGCLGDPVEALLGSLVSLLEASWAPAPLFCPF